MSDFKGPWFKTMEIFIVGFLLMAGSLLVIQKLAGGPMVAQETRSGPDLGVSAGIGTFGVRENVNGGEIVAPVSLLRQFPEGVAPVCNISASLVDVLASAVFPDKTVIVTAFTMPFAPMLDIFVERILKGRTTKALWPHIVVINFDESGFNYCCQQRMNCYFDSQEGVAEKIAYGAEEQKWAAPNYIKMMWRRLDILRSVLRLGYHLLFTDIDVAWLQDPSKELKSNDADLQLASDTYHPEDHIRTMINCGFFFARSTQPSLAFFDYWMKDHDTRFPGENEQDVMRLLRPESDPFTAGLGVKIRYLPTVLFATFCEMPIQMDQIMTIHPNCCKGLDTKLRVLRKSLEDYDWVMSFPVSFSNQLVSHDFHWLKPQC